MDDDERGREGKPIKDQKDVLSPVHNGGGSSEGITRVEPTLRGEDYKMSRTNKEKMSSRVRHSVPT